MHTPFGLMSSSSPTAVSNLSHSSWFCLMSSNCVDDMIT